MQCIRDKLKGRDLSLSLLATNRGENPRPSEGFGLNLDGIALALLSLINPHHLEEAWLEHKDRY